MASCSASEHLSTASVMAPWMPRPAPQERLCVVLESGRSEFAGIGHDGTDAVGDKLDNGPNRLVPVHDVEPIRSPAVDV
jgi:hypothetical protein